MGEVIPDVEEAREKEERERERRETRPEYKVLRSGGRHGCVKKEEVIHQREHESFASRETENEGRERERERKGWERREDCVADGGM